MSSYRPPYPPPAPPPQGPSGSGYSPGYPSGHSPGHSPGYPPGFPPSPFPFAAPPNPALGSANVSLGFGIASLVLCCAPVGIVALIFGLRATDVAKRNAVSAPARAIVGIVLAGISLLADLGVGIAYWHDSRTRDQSAAADGELVKGKLEGAALDLPVACALADKAILTGAYQDVAVYDKTTCDGSYQGDAKNATLTNVNATVGAKKVPLTVCFAKGSRWFVTSAVAAGSPCPTDLPPSPNATGAALDKAESDYRDEVKKLIQKRIGSSYVASLERLRDTIAHAPREERKCPAIDSSLVPSAGDGKIPVRGVDLELLTQPSARGDAGRWRFVTDPQIRTLLDPKTNDDDRTAAAKAIGEASGPYVMVWSSDDERSWPVVLPKTKKFTADLSYIGGSFDGWVFLGDLRDGSVICAAGFEARNSHSVWSSHSAGKEDVERNLESDLKTNFQQQAAVAVDSMSQGKMTLGYDPRE